MIRPTKGEAFIFGKNCQSEGVEARKHIGYLPGELSLYDNMRASQFFDMVDTMRAAPGVGLAGPQVNVSQRVFVAEFGNEDDKEAPKKLYAVVNPEITRSSQETLVAAEGCLSVPGLLGDVDRSLEVTVIGKNRRGQPLKIKAKGWLARIFQHEIDHINGILFLDRAEKVYEPVEETEPDMEETEA